MKLRPFFVVLFVFSLFVGFICYHLGNGAPGIIIVPGYEHGVALCEGEEGQNEEMVTQEDEYHMWMEDGVLFTVNYGHLDDDEVQELVRWGKHECAALRKEMSDE